MNSLLENIYSVSFVFGACFLLVALLMYIWPPKKINSSYGYRTARSMKSQEARDFAQKHSTKQMAIGGTVMIIASLTGGILKPHTGGFTVSIIIAALGTAFIIRSTEKAIKEKFNKE